MGLSKKVSGSLPEGAHQATETAELMIMAKGDGEWWLRVMVNDGKRSNDDMVNNVYQSNWTLLILPIDALSWQATIIHMRNIRVFGDAGTTDDNRTRGTAARLMLHITAPVWVRPNMEHIGNGIVKHGGMMLLC